MIEKTFVDRVPRYPGRVKLTPVPGAENTYTLERADNPTNPGTPIDKAAFDSITKSRLTGRFYVPTVTQTQLAGQSGITVSPLPSSGWTLDSSNLIATNGGYRITASSVGNGNDTPEKAVDGDESTMWRSGAGTSHTLTFSLPNVVMIDKFKMKMSLRNAAYSCHTELQGSINETSWTTIFDTYAKPDALQEFTVNISGSYRHYRLNFTHDAATAVYLSDFKISNYDVTMFRNEFTVPEFPYYVWTKGQRVTIQTPADTGAFAVMSNLLNDELINTILLPSRRYELRYTGTSFTAKEV